MRRLAIIAVCFAFLLSGCANFEHSLAGISEWTVVNSKSLDRRYEKASDEEKAFLRAHVNPYMNILKHSCIALDDYDKGDDMAAAKEIYYVTRVASELGIGYQALIYALENNDGDLAARELKILKFKIQTNAGVKPKQEKKPGFIRRAWNAMFW